MSTPAKYTGPVTGRVYDLSKGERIDPEAEGIGCAGGCGFPDAIVDGKKKFSRILVRRKRPEEILSRLNVHDPETLQRQIECVVAYIIDFSKKPVDYELRFECVPITHQ